MTLWFMFMAGILYLFRLDELATNGVNELIGKKFTTSIYWLTFLVIGLVLDIVYGIVNLFS
ncbi:hypothetical protein AF332_11655 [Sporosarcina globispora]|uniref:Uncharacterized protein n=1 Tax=Sporosarcina globispora TaxID=1459 RepID=A0A0M0GDB3_SPOGL|nr:hypothetical protein AF332_11655 [Sporosarcina globispora]